MIVDIVHPVILRHRPPGARQVRDILAKAKGTAELRVLPEGSLRPIGSFVETFPHYDVPRNPRGPAPVADFEGRRYVRMDTSVVGGGHRPLFLRELTGYLAMKEDRTLAHLPLDNAFVGTPVRDLYGVASLSRTLADPRGIDVPEARRGLVEHDGHAEASAALQAHLNAEILVEGVTVYQRFRPYARSFEGRGGRGANRIAIRTESGTTCGGPMPFAAARHDEARRFAGYERHGGFVDGAEATLALLPEDHDDGEDVRRVSRFLLSMAASWMASAERQAKAAGREVGETRSLAAALTPWHMAARIGVLPEAAYPDAVQALSKALHHLTEVARPAAAVAAHVAQAQRYVSTVAQPRFAETIGVHPEDAIAIGGMRS